MRDLNLDSLPRYSNFKFAVGLQNLDFVAAKAMGLLLESTQVPIVVGASQQGSANLAEL